MRQIASRQPVVPAGILGLVLILGVQPILAEEAKPAGRDAAKATPAESQEQEDAGKPDPYAVPDGDAAQLVDFIGQLMGRQVAGRAEFEKLVAAIVQAADKILAGQPDAAQTVAAVNAKLQALAALRGHGNEKAKQEITALIKSVRDSNVPAVQALVKRFVLGERLQDWNRLDLDKKQSLAADVVSFITQTPVDPAQFQLVMRLGQMAEMSGNNAVAARLYERVAPIFQKSDDAQLARYGGHLAGMARRLTLVGKQMKVEGKLLNGDAFDWSAYRGRVVLVEFWATWCPPCRAELPHLKETYSLYHDKGFDVVGVSVDSDKKQLEDFVGREKIPWPILFNNDSAAPGGGDSLADYYGITGVPTAILVNRDGKVVTLVARGERLTRELEKLLGKVERKPPEDQANEDDRVEGDS